MAWLQMLVSCETEVFPNRKCVKHWLEYQWKHRKKWKYTNNFDFCFEPLGYVKVTIDISVFKFAVKTYMIRKYNVYTKLGTLNF